MATTSSDVSRRGFLLLQTLKGAIGLTLLVILYPVAWFLRPRKATTSGALEVVAPFKLNELATTTSNPFDFGGKPCLVVLTPEGAAAPRGGTIAGSGRREGVQCRLHARGLHGQVSPCHG